jgi:hypothetical protein
MDFKNIISTIDGLAKDDDNIVFLHDSFDLELNEHFVIETGVVGFTEDGIILEADDETMEFLELNDMLAENNLAEDELDVVDEGRYKYRESEDDELDQIKELANIKENPNPGDFNSAMASPIGSINKNDEERVADANVTGKDPLVVSEKWSGDTEIKSTGKWADKTIAELKKARSALKNKEDRTKEETSKLRQINFAIRSKKDWKGGVAETDMPPESSLDLTSPISGGNMREDVSLDEAEYQGRKVTLNKPMQGDVKKSKVYVKNAKGNVVKVNFGHGGSSAKGKTMSIKKNNPERRKAFRARHNCKNPGPKWKARYWSCRAW